MDAKPSKNPTVAGILSGLMPGLGQFYCRQWKKGAGFLVGAIVVDAALGVSAGFLKLLQTGGMGLTPDEATSILLRSLPFLALALWSVVDAVRTARRSS
ncbi:MAG: hypothetical protein AB1411_04390 [Nitrospirota bacterium]